MSESARLDALFNCLADGLLTDGAHHKQENLKWAMKNFILLYPSFKDEMDRVFEEVFG